MHCEAFTYTRQTLSYKGPRSDAKYRSDGTGGPWPGDVEVESDAFLLGADPRRGGFVFDNEKWAHPVTLGPFRIARAPVTNSEFAAFVDAEGYRRKAYWHEAGWKWLERTGARAPAYWTSSNGNWCRRVFDAVQPLAPHAPVVHVNWYEADAWCRWAGRRLPSEAEWECAAATAPGVRDKRDFPWGSEAPSARRANLFGSAGRCVDVADFAAGDSAWGCRQMIGNVWEWTADWFGAYPGFAPDPYREYSAPWFGNHKVLRGGCFATRPGLLRNTWRNFYTPDRRDVFAGFRTCAL